MGTDEKYNIDDMEMTNQEKKAFAEIVLGSAGQRIQYFQKEMRNNIIGSITALAIALAASWWFGIKLVFVLPFAVLFIGGSCLMTYFACNSGIKNILKNASNGKVDYKLYKQLLKSGELDRWMKLNGNATLDTEQKPN